MTAAPYDPVVEAFDLYRQGRLAEAERRCRVLRFSRPEDARVWQLSGGLALEQGRHAEAEAHFDRAIAISPQGAAHHNNRGVLLGALGRFAEAEDSFRKAVELAPRYVEALYNFSESYRWSPGDPLIGQVEALIAAGDWQPQEAMFLNFAAGRMYEQLGDTAKAFRHARLANRARGARFDSSMHERFVDRLIASFSPALLERGQRLGSASERPVFIVGMPRAGTTLVERLIAGHPQIFAAGELDLLRELAGRIGGYPGRLAELAAPQLAAMAKHYEAATARLAASRGEGTATRILDKAPLNGIHVGLIALLWPRARIVFCRRDPRDTCLSCFQQRFAFGHEYAYDLKTLGHFHRHYWRLLDHWRAHLPLRMLTLDYEATVAAPEETTRRLLDFLDLPWDQACAQPERAEGPVLTASRWQARQPVHQGSVGRWRRYEAELAPLIAALEEDEQAPTSGAALAGAG